MINHRIIIKLLGYLLLLETVLMIASTCVSLYYGDNSRVSLLISSIITGSVGSLMVLLYKDDIKALTRREGYIIISVTWLAFALFGMLPFYIGGHIPRLADAFFEAMSGFTSTGATILDDIDNMPKGLLFWRAISQWFGGLGIIMFTIAILPTFGINGLQMFAAEVNGPAHNRVTPRIGMTARWIWYIYIGMTAILILLLKFGGMGMFDSICHAMSTAATGGFSTHQDSVAYFHSPYIEYVLSIFMFVSGINFSLLILLLSGRLRKVAQDEELRWYSIFVIVITIAFTVVLHLSRSMGVEEAFRKSIFQVTSLFTSTGFATDDYMQWPVAVWGTLLLIMIIGACAGSTSGGLKFVRLQILVKNMKNELKHILHPNAILPIRLNNAIAQPSLVNSVMAFSFLYIFTVFTSTLIMAAVGMNFMDAMGVTISSLGNMGAAIGNYGPANSWSGLPDIVKWVVSILMLLGRVEIFTVIILFTPNFWKKN